MSSGADRGDLFRIRPTHGVIDHHGEICPAVDRKCRILEGNGAENRMADVFDGLAMMAADVVVAPHRLELRAEPTELIDQRLHLRCGSCPCRIHPERADYKTCD